MIFVNKKPPFIKWWFFFIGIQEAFPVSASIQYAQFSFRLEASSKSLFFTTEY